MNKNNMNKNNMNKVYQDNLELIIKNNKEFLKQGIDPIYHGVKYEFIENIVENWELEPRTYHRYWKDGSRRKENWDGYQDSYWKFGWCMSRDFQIALNFGAIIFVLDKNKLKENFQVEPFAWNYHFTDKYVREINHKKEREEFVIAKKTDISIGLMEKKQKDIEERILPEMYDIYKKMPKDTVKEKKQRKLYKKLINEQEDLLMINPRKLLDNPHGNNLKLSNCMIGFYLDDVTCGIYDGRYLSDTIKEKEMEFINNLKKHPKFLGLLNKQKLIDKIEEEKLENKKRLSM